MAVNRYDRAAEAAFINTYAPIDFGALYQIGAANNAAVEKALKELSGQLADWATFQSQSAVDTANFYKMSYGQVKDLIDEAAVNPEKMKDASFRSKLAGRLNSLDIASMSKLKQNAENYKKRVENIAILKSKGLYAPWLDKVNIANWDTLNQGMMTELMPLVYQSLEEIGTPYVKDIQPTFYVGNKSPIRGKKRDFTSGWMAVTANDIARSLRFGEIKNTPIGAAWLDRYKQLNPNKTSEEVEAMMFKDLIAAQSDKIREMPVDDKMGFERWKLQQSNNNPSVNPLTTRIGEYQVQAQKTQEDFIKAKRDQLAKTGVYKTEKELDEAVINEMRNPKYRKELSVTIKPGEYNEMFGVNDNTKISLTTEKGEPISNRYNYLERYSWRPGDVVFTTDGKVLADIPKSIFTDSSKLGASLYDPMYGSPIVQKSEPVELKGEEVYYMINTVLAALSEKPGVSYNVGPNAVKYSHINGNLRDNSLLVDGKLIFSEEVLENTIESLYPEVADDLIRVFKKGFKESRDDKNPSHKIMTKLNVKDAYLDGYDDLYEITYGRGFGTEYALGMEFNTQNQKDRYGASAASKVVPQTAGITIQETNNSSSFSEPN